MAADLFPTPIYSPMQDLQKRPTARAPRRFSRKVGCVVLSANVATAAFTSGVSYSAIEVGTTDSPVLILASAALQRTRARRPSVTRVSEEYVDRKIVRVAAQKILAFPRHASKLLPPQVRVYSSDLDE